MNCDDILRLAPLYNTGELESELYGAFDAHLKTCSACMDELQRQARLDVRLREVILAEDREANVTAVDRRVRKLIAAEAQAPPANEPRSGVPRRRVAITAVGIAAAFVLLAAVGYLTLVGGRVAPLYAAAANDHRIEIVEQQPRKWLTDPAEIGSLAEGQGIAPAAVTALSSGGYRLVKGKLCFLDRRIFLHLVFSDGGREFSVYLRQRDGAPLDGRVRETVNGKPLCTSDAEHEHVASIETGQLIVLAVSAQSSDAAAKLARFAASVL